MSKCRTLRIPAALPVCAALLIIRTAPVVAVTNTWYNRLVGDAALPVDRRITRTEVPTSSGRRWADLKPIDSGLMGPVRLVARQQVRLQWGRVRAHDSGKLPSTRDGAGCFRRQLRCPQS